MSHLLEELGSSRLATVLGLSEELRLYERKVDLSSELSYAEHVPVVTKRAVDPVETPTSVTVAGDPQEASALRSVPPEQCSIAGTLEALGDVWSILVLRELFFGVPADALDRVAHFEDDPAGTAMFASLPPDFPLFKAAPRSLFPNAAYANNVGLLTSDVPAGGVVSARAMARMYAALLGDVGSAAGRAAG